MLVSGNRSYTFAHVSGSQAAAVHQLARVWGTLLRPHVRQESQGCESGRCQALRIQDSPSSIRWLHWLNMELDLQSLFGLLCTSVLIVWDAVITPLRQHLGSYTRALLVSQDRRHLDVTPWLTINLVWRVFWSGEVSVLIQKIQNVSESLQTRVTLLGTNWVINCNFLAPFWASKAPEFWLTSDPDPAFHTHTDPNPAS